jgi:O-6-methylguanine DNA methyltransferase
VWRARQRLPYGSVTTYGALARELRVSDSGTLVTGARPTAAQKVAWAVAATPTPIVVPCHRVLGAHGALTGYRGGLWRKRALLDCEAASASDRSSAIAKGDSRSHRSGRFGGSPVNRASRAWNQPAGRPRVRESSSGRRRHALWRDADGRHQPVLGPARVMNSGKRSGRGAVVWHTPTDPSRRRGAGALVATGQARMVLGAILRFAQRRELIDANPIARHRISRQSSRRRFPRRKARQRGVRQRGPSGWRKIS